MLEADAIITIILTGLFTGLGSTVGNYIAQTRLIARIEAVQKRIDEERKQRNAG